MKYIWQTRENEQLVWPDKIKKDLLGPMLYKSG